MRARDDRPPFFERLKRRLWGVTHPATWFTGRVVFTATLRARKIDRYGKITDYGVVSRRLVTQAFVKRLAAQMAADFAGADEWKWHHAGTSSTAESNADTGMGTPITEARVAGTQADVSAGTVGIYRTVATITFLNAYTLREHGVFNASVVGTLLDRSVYAAIVVAALDSVEYTYELTANPE